MAQVTDTLTGKAKHVSNLGWLLRNWQRVETIIIQDAPGGLQIEQDGKMIVILDNGLEYSCLWADLSICWKWLQRPVFYGVDLIWLGYRTKIKKGNPRPEGL
jgi:hypothetical protein